MEREFIDCEQNSVAWIMARCGRITASCFQDAMAKPTRGFLPNAYAYKVAGERIRNTPAESFTSSAMTRGHAFEPVARELYEKQTGNVVQPIGFIAWGRIGGSADGLVNDDGIIEIKTADSHLQIKTLLSQEVPEEHIAQVQGNLWVSDRKWCDFISYCEGLPLFVRRVERDDKYISELEAKIHAFDTEVESLVAKIKTMF